MNNQFHACFFLRLVINLTNCCLAASPRNRKNVITCLTVSDSPVSDNDTSNNGNRSNKKSGLSRSVKDEHGGQSQEVGFIAIDRPTGHAPSSSNCSSGKSSCNNNSNSSSSGRHHGPVTPQPDLIRDTIQSSEARDHSGTGPGKPHHHSMCNISKTQEAALAPSSTSHGSHSSRTHQGRRGHSLTPPKMDIKFPPLLLDVTPVNPLTHTKFQQISPTDNNNSWSQPCNRSRPSTLNLNEMPLAGGSSGSTINTVHNNLQQQQQQLQQQQATVGSHLMASGSGGSSGHKNRPAPLNLGISRPGVSIQQHSPPGLTSHGPQGAQPVYLNTLSTLNTLNTINTINTFNNATVPDNYR